MEDRYSRVRRVFGEDFEKLQRAKILLLGIGGVGSPCLDALYRTGISDITIVDFDTYDVTNQNRQLGSEAVGEVKVLHMASLYKGVTPVEAKVTPAWVENFDFEPYIFPVIFRIASEASVKPNEAVTHIKLPISLQIGFSSEKTVKNVP